MILSTVNNDLYIIWIDIALAVILLGIFSYFSIKKDYSHRLTVSIAIYGVILGAAVALKYNVFAINLLVVGFIFLTAIFFAKDHNEREKYLHHKKKSEATSNHLSNSETDKLFEKLYKAVSDLSTKKTGALITIERTDNLNSFLSTSGVSVDAPVSAELLETIFVNKTPLHDGAVIIRGNYIVAASVFYQPTQKALSGKYGSRHRAAIGISEVCDALTIVVSEETGKVSFALNGDLIPVPVTSFINRMKEYYYF